MNGGEEGAIVPAGLLRPVAKVDEIVKNWQLFQELKRRLLTNEDYQSIAGKSYIKRSGFRKVALAFGISDRILSSERTDREDGSFMWRILVEVTAPNGRVCQGVGACDSRERGFAHLEHDVLSTAHTRSKSRAISDMVAGGVVSAEEMQTPTMTGGLEGPPPEELPFTVTWKVGGAEAPIPVNTGAYGSFRSRLLQGYRDKYEADFSEEIVGDHVVAIGCSELEDEQWKGLEKYLIWVLKTVNNCPPEQVSVELVKVEEGGGEK